LNDEARNIGIDVIDSPQFVHCLGLQSSRLFLNNFSRE
jgi:hypothetical protein